MKLTNEQNKLIKSNGNTILKAGPGSGKTSSLVSLINKELEEWKKEHRGIAILSFCNSSVEELKNKIENIDYPHYIGTIDGFAEKYIFYPFSPNLFFKNKDKAKIVTNDTYFSDLKAKSYFKQECYKCNSSINNILINTNGSIKAPKEKCIGNNLPCVRYKKMVLQRNCVTYDDAMSIAILIMKKYSEIAKLLAKRFPLIIIDEAQDMSKNQMELIEQFEKNNSTIIIVGDADQAIYEWRSATPEIFINKYENSDYNKIEFLENHRSSQIELIFKETVTNVEEKTNVILKKYNIEQWNRIVNDFLIEIPSSNIILKQWDNLMQEKLNQLLGTKNEKYIKIKRNSLNDLTKDFKEKELYYFDKENTNNSLAISTIHSAKGKTYEAVMLIIKQRGKLTFNSLNKECNETEEIRTAYVAMTRPQKILIIALPKSVKKVFEKSTKFDKRFWTYIDL